MFRFEKWAVGQQPDGLYALYEDAPYSNHPTCKSFHYSLCAAVAAITRYAIAENTPLEDLWTLWDSMGEIYEHAEQYAPA